MQNQMNKYRRLKNLFLRQSYLDAWEDYQRSILKKFSEVGLYCPDSVQ